MREDDITQWFEQNSGLDFGQFPIGIGDDMAQVRIGAESVLITTDMLLDGRHFDLNQVSIKQAGYKAMAASLSDCAAMATKPVAAVVSVGLPAGFASEQLKELHAGITQAGDKYGCKLIGGDITTWAGAGRFVINVAMISSPVEGIQPLTRSGAKAGDAICVTGFLGGSLMGRHIDFEPRVAEAIQIAGLVKVNAMMDISDGLSCDLTRICKRSGVGALIDAQSIPISQEAQAGDDPLLSALNDGEDFELLFTLAQDQYLKLMDLWDQQLQISKVGSMTQGNTMKITGYDGVQRRLEAGGFDHFKGDSRR
jgi:thiamine-monophosphate kinase